MVKSFFKDTKIIFLFEEMSKIAIFFLRSLPLSKSETKVYSELDINFFNPEILNFSSTKRIRFVVFFLIKAFL